MRRLFVLLATCLAFTGGQALAKKLEFTRPPYAGAYEPQGVDERGLWMEADEEERTLRDQPYVLKSPALEAYLREILCNTVGVDRCSSARIYIIKDASFNASMAPNGLMLVHTGLLARLHSDAELATVLGHEFAHFEKRHSLHGFASRRSATDAISWISLTGAVLGQSTSDIQNSIIFGVYAFTRVQESEADSLSGEFVRASRYRLRGSDVWLRAQQEEEALRAERGLKKLERLSPGLLDSHPTNSQRMSYFVAAESGASGDGEDGFEHFKSVTESLTQEIFEPLVRGNEFGAADYVIRARGEALGWDAPLLYSRGELYRLRAYPRDLVTARDLFRQAIILPNSPPQAWRGLGLVEMKLGEAEVGKTALAEYLKRAPQAADAATIGMLLK
jgi:beta-barrel assembly-enhancing protease